LKSVGLELTKRDIEDLRRRIEEVKAFDPVKYTAEVVKALKEAGLIREGGGSPPNPEIEKMRLEIEKWRTEKELELQRWMAEHQKKLMELQHSHQTTMKVADLFRDAMKTFGPMLGRGLFKSPAQQGGQQQQSSGELDLSKLSDEELSEYLSKLDEAHQEIAKMKQKILAEMERRRQAASSGGESKQ